MSTYFVIQDNEDGRNITPYDKGGLNKLLTGFAEDWGKEVKILKEFPKEPYCFESMAHNEFCIIKGEVVVPKKKEVVTSWEIK